MSFEHAITSEKTGIAPAGIFATAGPFTLATFLRTGFDGDVIVIYMRPERVFGFQKAKLQLVFETSEPDASVASAEAGAAGCDERKFDGRVSASGFVSFQQLAVLAEFLGKTLADQGRQAGVELELQVLSPSGDLEAAKAELDALAKEVFVQ